MKKRVLLLIFLVNVCVFTQVLLSKEIPIIYHENYNINPMVSMSDTVLSSSSTPCCLSYLATCTYDISEFLPFDLKKKEKIFKFISEELELNKDFFYCPEPVSDKDLRLVHTNEYLNKLNNPAFIASVMGIPKFVEIKSDALNKLFLLPAKLATGGTILGCDLALKYGVAVNLSGGFHHAKAGSGGGFCFFNDIAIASYKFLQKYPESKILIIDLDAHQGNGYKSIFKNNRYYHNKVFVFDIYNRDAYPKGQDPEYGPYNSPVSWDISTNNYLALLKENLDKAVQEVQPNLIIYNAGTDVLLGDKLGGMQISFDGVTERDRFVFSVAQTHAIPILMLLAGGYSDRAVEAVKLSINNLIL